MAIATKIPSRSSYPLNSSVVSLPDRFSLWSFTSLRGTTSISNASNISFVHKFPKKQMQEGLPNFRLFRYSYTAHQRLLKYMVPLSRLLAELQILCGKKIKSNKWVKTLPKQVHICSLSFLYLDAVLRSKQPCKAV